MDTDQLAVSFLEHFIDVPENELKELAITHCLSDLLSTVVKETVEILTEEEQTIH
tara:strand:- start:5958 stop:6122 length:165 start_codon:yes stop_codon:yes gene_type:complete